MLIKLIAVGHNMPNWVTLACDDYRSRLRQDIQLQLIEIPLQKRLDKGQLKAAQEKETQAILNKVGESFLVALDVTGKQHSSEGLAQRLQHWQTHHREMALVIGAPEGLTEALRNRAQEFWSLSALTLPHTLVRVMVLEALYRAWSINQNHPYHRV